MAVQGWLCMGRKQLPSSGCVAAADAAGEAHQLVMILLWGDAP